MNDFDENSSDDTKEDFEVDTADEVDDVDEAVDLKEGDSPEDPSDQTTGDAIASQDSAPDEPSDEETSETDAPKPETKDGLPLVDALADDQMEDAPPEPELVNDGGEKSEITNILNCGKSLDEVKALILAANPDRESVDINEDGTEVTIGYKSGNITRMSWYGALPIDLNSGNIGTPHNTESFFPTKDGITKKRGFTDPETGHVYDRRFDAHLTDSSGKRKPMHRNSGADFDDLLKQGT